MDPPDERPENPVRRHRKRRQLTQEQLADRVGCDQSMISAIERGTSPSLKLAQAIAAEFEVTLDELFGQAVTS